MAERHWAKLLPRADRERFPRWTHLFAPDSEAADTPAPSAEPSASAPASTVQAVANPPKTPWSDEMKSLRADIEALRGEVDELKARLDRVGG